MIHDAQCDPPVPWRPPPHRNVPPAPEPVSPPKRRMTIAAGFVCRDGVVLGADSQVTGAIKFSRDKVWVLPTRDASQCVAMAGAGDVVLIRAVRDALAESDRRRFDPPFAHLAQVLSSALTPSDDPQPPLDRLVERLQAALETFYEHHIYPAPNWEESRPLRFLLAVQAGGQAALFDQSGPTLARTTSHVCIGSGSDLGQYLQETRFTSEMDMATGRRVVAHLLKQVKTYSTFCGGDSHILLVPHEGPATFATARQIRKDERDDG